MEVNFHPNSVNPDVRIEKIRCRLQHSSGIVDGTSSGSDLTLTLTGACVACAPVADPVTFRCCVRNSTTNSVCVRNDTSAAWTLRPVIQNDFFSGPDILTVPHGSSATYTVTYHPLTMTPPEGSPHTGSVFFPIPDGSGLLYALHGTVRCTWAQEAIVGIVI